MNARPHHLLAAVSKLFWLRLLRRRHLYARMAGWDASWNYPWIGRQGHLGIEKFLVEVCLDPAGSRLQGLVDILF